MKLLFLAASAHAFGAGFGEMAEDWDCSKYDEKEKESYMQAGIHSPHYESFMFCFLIKKGTVLMKIEQYRSSFDRN